MDTADFTACLRSILNEFPPRSYSLETVTIKGNFAALHIRPKSGFSGQPKNVTIAISNDRNALTLAMMQAGLMQRQYEATPGPGL